jgi:hypothetical protein
LPVLGSRDGQVEPTLTEDDKALRQWFNSNVLQDSRCNSKLILKLAASALHSDEFRARLVDHTDEVLAEVDECVEIPMVGCGASLNVAVAGSLVAYRLAGLS